MKVAELIDELEQLNAEAEVHFVYNYGDHWRTNVAPAVKIVEEGYIRDSDYHRMPKVVEEDEDQKEGDREVVLIKATRF